MSNLGLVIIMYGGALWLFSWAWFNWFLVPFMAAIYVCVFIATCMGANPALLIVMTLSLVVPGIAILFPSSEKQQDGPAIHFSHFNGTVTGNMVIPIDDDQYDPVVHLTDVLSASGYQVVEHTPLSAKLMWDGGDGMVEYCKVQLQRTTVSVLVTVSSTNEFQCQAESEHHVETLLNLFCE